MKIIISGVTGFVGAHIFRHFAKMGHQLIGLGRATTPPAGLTSYGEYQCLDLSHDFDPQEADCVIHCAGYANDRGSWQDFYQNNVVTTQNIFSKIKAPIFINISSASIYGYSPAPIQEHEVDAGAMPSLYGRSKWEAEEFIQRNSAEKKSITILRPRAIYGTHDRILLPRILAFGKSGKMKLPGDGRVQLSMTHIDNLIAAVSLAIERHHHGCHVYNVADDQSYEFREVVHSLLSGVMNREIPVREIPKPLVRAIVQITSVLKIPFPLTPQSFDYITKPRLLSIEKIKKDLGYRAKTDFNESLPDIVRWARTIEPEQFQNNLAALPWTNLDY